MTFPNHFSIATGLYEESHGVIDNFVYDPNLKRDVTVQEPEMYLQNHEALPLWVSFNFHCLFSFNIY